MGQLISHDAKSLGQIGSKRELDIIQKVQLERDNLARLSKPHHANKFLVGRNVIGTKIAILCRPARLISPDDALLLAAYLITEADTSADLRAFNSVLSTVQAQRGR